MLSDMSVEAMRSLKRLRDEDLINDKEYADTKKRVLDDTVARANVGSWCSTSATRCACASPASSSRVCFFLPGANSLPARAGYTTGTRRNACASGQAACLRAPTTGLSAEDCATRSVKTRLGVVGALRLVRRPFEMARALDGHT